MKNSSHLAIFQSKLGKRYLANELHTDGTTHLDTTWHFRNRLEMATPFSEYRKLIDVQVGRFPDWARRYTGELLSV